MFSLKSVTMLLGSLSIALSAQAYNSPTSTNTGKSQATVATAPATQPKAAMPIPATGEISWTGTGIGKSHTGSLNLKSGTVEVEKNQVVSGTFEFDMSTIAYKGDKRLVDHLKSPDFFDIAKFPTAKFVITKAEAIPGAKKDQPTHKITGDLTIRDRTNPVTFDAIVTRTGTQWTAKGNIVIPDRTKFGITYNSKQFFDIKKLGDKLINDEITIGLNVTAETKAAATPAQKKM